MTDQPLQGWLPAHVRHADVSSSAKVFYSEVAGLAVKEGYCYATNGYFARIYDVDKRTVKDWIQELEEAGVLVRDYDKDRDKHQRRLYLAEYAPDPPGNIPHPPGKNISSPQENNFPQEVSRRDYQEDKQSSGSTHAPEVEIGHIWDFLPEQHQDVRADIEGVYQELKEGKVDMLMLARRYLARNGQTPPKNTVADHCDKHPKPKVVAAYVVAGIKADSNPTSYASTILKQDWTRDGNKNGQTKDKLEEIWQGWD